MALTGGKCRYCKKWVVECNSFTTDVCGDCSTKNNLDGFDKIRLENAHRLGLLAELSHRFVKRWNKIGK